MELIAVSPHNRLTDDEPTERAWTREEYYRLAEEGFFEGQRVQLLKGRIYQMPPQGLPHTVAVELAENAVRKVFGTNHRFRVQMPFHTADGSDPEPDIAVVPGSPRDAATSHPTNASLVIEVSDTSLRIDREKASVYARSGITDFWILNLVDSTVEVYRDPSPASDGSAWAYATVRTLKRGESISPTAATNAVISVNDLLP